MAGEAHATAADDPLEVHPEPKNINISYENILTPLITFYASSTCEGFLQQISLVPARNLIFHLYSHISFSNLICLFIANYLLFIQ